MAQVNDLSRSLTAFIPISTSVVVVEMSKASRMPELGPYGSVRGARGNSRPYRESNWPAVGTTLAQLGNSMSRRFRIVEGYDFCQTHPVTAYITSGR